MKLSVIIVNYNVRYFLELCLQSVQEALNDIDSEIIVVDNASVDDSCKMVKEKFPEVILISNTENLGFSKANNQGVEVAKGKYVLILNPDTVVGKDTFIKILAFAKTRQNFGALGVKLIDGKGLFLPESKRGIPTPTASFYKLIGFTSKTTGKYYANHLSVSETGIVKILVGAFMLMKRSVYNEVKGFDEAYFMYGEDIDLSYKILNKGYQNYYYADTQVIHYKGESTIKNAQNLHNFHKAMEIFYEKHFKINKVYDFIMRFGIKFWYILKFLGLKNESNGVVKQKRTLYVGCDVKIMDKLLSVNSKTFKCESTGFDEIKKHIKQHRIEEVVFDNSQMCYQQIISNIDILKNGITFKIHPKNTNYIIGSNSSVSKGEIILLD